MTEQEQTFRSKLSNEDTWTWEYETWYELYKSIMWLSSRVHRKWTCFDTWLKNNQVLSKVERRVHLVFVQAQWARKVQAVPWHMWNIGKRTCTGVALNLKIWQQQSIISLSPHTKHLIFCFVPSHHAQRQAPLWILSFNYAYVVAYRHSVFLDCRFFWSHLMVVDG